MKAGSLAVAEPTSVPGTSERMPRRAVAGLVPRRDSERFAPVRENRGDYYEAGLVLDARKLIPSAGALACGGERKGNSFRQPRAGRALRGAPSPGTSEDDLSTGHPVAGHRGIPKQGELMVARASRGTDLVHAGELQQYLPYSPPGSRGTAEFSTGVGVASA
eukprot:2275320-Rhodomonas_salina.1